MLGEKINMKQHVRSNFKLKKNLKAKTHFPTECTVLQVLAAFQSGTVLHNCDPKFYHFKRVQIPHSITLFAAFSQS